MLKRIPIIFLFFSINASFAQNLTASQKIQDSVSAGSTFIVSTTITRNQVIDVMEFSQSFPQGFSATDVDSKGGDFEFEKNEVKIIWLSPPIEDTYSVSYQVRAPSDTSGILTFGGKIIYITSNIKRNVFIIPPRKIILVNPKNQGKTQTQNSGVVTLGSQADPVIPVKQIKPVESTKLPTNVSEKSPSNFKRLFDSLKLADSKAEAEGLRVKTTKESEKTAPKNATNKEPEKAAKTDLLSKLDLEPGNPEAEAVETGWSSIASSLAETEALRLKLNMEPEKTEALTAQTGWSSDNIKETSATRADNNASISQLKTKLEASQSGINRLKSELENTTVSQINILNAINSKNTSSVIRTDALLAELTTKSDFNESEIIRLKMELEKAKIIAANTLRIINLKNSAANNEAAAMLSQLKMKSDSGSAEITKLKSDLDKIKVSESNTSNAISSSGGTVRTSQSDYFTDETGKPVSNGFYVIIGTFGSRENADRFRATNHMIGHLNTKIILNQFTKVYNIYCLKANNRADAETERTKYKPEYPDAWILKLE